MIREDRISICKTCTKRKLNMKIGLICSITDKLADFESKCPDYSIDEEASKFEVEEKLEKKIADKGRKKTLNVFYLLVGFSISVLTFSHLMSQNFNSTLITRGVIRLVLEIGLYYAIFNGKNWGRILITILFIAAILFSLTLMIYSLGTYVAVIMIALILVYGFGIYFFNYDKDFKVFFRYQKKNI